MVSSILPDGHYTQVLCSGLSKKVNLTIYTDKNKKNLTVKKCGRIRLVWNKNRSYIVEIVKQIKKDKPHIVHLQHEINMFGGSINAAFFPFLSLLIRLNDIKVVTTIHAVVSQNQIDSIFAKTFNFNEKIINPTILKIFFKYLYKSIVWSSNQCVVHTPSLKNILVNEYGIDEHKICVIKHPIYQYKISNDTIKEKYFLYFGYMVKRKGLDKVLEGYNKFVTKFPKNEYHLVFAGGTIEGQEISKNEIVELIKRQKMGGKVSILGFVDSKQQRELYEKAYAVIVPSVLSIAASGPLCHARGYGKCILASNIGTLSEEITDGVSGILVKNSEWEKAFSYAVNNPDKVMEYEKQSLVIAKQRSPLKTASQLAKIYQEIK